MMDAQLGTICRTAIQALSVFQLAGQLAGQPVCQPTGSWPRSWPTHL